MPKVMFIEGGKVVKTGPPDQLFNNPKNERAKEFLLKN